MTEKPLVLIDGICNFCVESVRHILELEKEPYFYFASFQTEIGKEVCRKYNINPEKLDSIILIENGKTYDKSSAALKIASKLKFPLKQLAFFAWFIPKIVRDWVYKVVARNRYKIFGKRNECYLPDGETLKRFL